MIQLQSGIVNYYPQERDWTCGLACLRTLLNATYRKKTPLSEEELVARDKERGAVPGPRTASDLKNLLKAFQLDEYLFTPEDFEIKDIYDCFTAHLIAVESRLHGGHWLVIMSISKGKGSDYIELYDPYYDKILSFTLSQFYALWMDDKLLSNSREFIAVRRI